MCFREHRQHKNHKTIESREKEPFCTSTTCTYSRLSLSRISGDSLKHFEISVPRNIRVPEVRRTMNRTTTLNKWICNLSYILKILWKRGEIAPKEQFLLFSTIFCYLFLDFHVKTGTRISLRDKRLFEISEVEITRVDCTTMTITSTTTTDIVVVVLYNDVVVVVVVVYVIVSLRVHLL